MLNKFQDVIWFGNYPIDSLQIYFAASLEIQEELIKHGFYVPKSPDGRVIAPVPIIYSNFRGWLKPVEPLTIERLIPPEWIGLAPSELNWRKTFRERKEAYILPEEEVYVNIGVSKNTVIFDLNVKGYHLERTSIRGINPDKWTNWVMFYIDLKYVDEIINLLKNYLPKDLRCTVKPKKEVQQGGKEITYYVTVPVKDFSFCLGCFELVQKYLHTKAIEHCKINSSCDLCRNPESVIGKLWLRLKFTPSVNTFAKVGVAKVAGKRPQIMVKLASTAPQKVIRGTLKEEVRGKARGELTYCDHKDRKQYVELDLMSFYKALTVTRNYMGKLPKNDN